MFVLIRHMRKTDILINKPKCQNCIREIEDDWCEICNGHFLIDLENLNSINQ